MANTTGKPKPRQGTRFPGIVAHARKLRVNRVTLYRALTGEWDLPGLVSRYNKLVSKEAGR